MPAVLVAMVEGLQVPSIPLLDCNGNTGGVLFKHKGSIGSKVGTVADAQVPPLQLFPLIEPSISLCHAPPSGILLKVLPVAVGGIADVTFD